MNNLDKLILRTGGLILLSVPLLWIAWWWILPVTINRHSDIKFANKIIEQIETYQKLNGLPKSDDWKTLTQFDFKEEDLGIEPAYEKINDDTFEIIFLEGFDGPYLLWNSKERIWKKDFFTIPDDRK